MTAKKPARGWTSWSDAAVRKQSETIEAARALEELRHRMEERLSPGGRAKFKAEREAEVQAKVEQNIRGDIRRARAEAKRAAKSPPKPRGELSKLIGALNLLASPVDGERAAAALKVEVLRAMTGKQWHELLTAQTNGSSPPKGGK